MIGMMWHGKTICTEGGDGSSADVFNLFECALGL